MLQRPGTSLEEVPGLCILPIDLIVVVMDVFFDMTFEIFLNAELVKIVHPSLPHSLKSPPSGYCRGSAPPRHTLSAALVIQHLVESPCGVEKIEFVGIGILAYVEHECSENRGP